MTEKVHISGYCPICEYTFEKTVKEETVQTALEKYNNPEDAAQQFLGEIPFTPTQIVLGLTVIANTLKISVKILEGIDYIKNRNEQTIDANCPECGNSKYQLEIEQL